MIYVASSFEVCQWRNGVTSIVPAGEFRSKGTACKRTATTPSNTHIGDLISSSFSRSFSILAMASVPVLFIESPCDSTCLSEPHSRLKWLRVCSTRSTTQFRWKALSVEKREEQSGANCDASFSDASCNEMWSPISRGTLRVFDYSFSMAARKLGNNQKYFRLEYEI